MVLDYRPDPGIPNLVYIGLPNKASLLKTLNKIKSHQIPHSPWEEPDWDMGFTAIATAPISGSIRDVFYKYTTFKFGGGRAEKSAPCEGNLNSATNAALTVDASSLQ